MYTKYQFGKDLKDLVIKKHNIEEIGAWSHTVFLEYEDVNDTKFLDLLLRLGTMELGPEFAFSYEELDKIADNLMEGNDINFD